MVRRFCDTRDTWSLTFSFVLYLVDEEAIRRATSEVEHWTRAIAEMVGKLQATIPEEERFRQRQNDLDAEKVSRAGTESVQRLCGCIRNCF